MTQMQIVNVFKQTNNMENNHLTKKKYPNFSDVCCLFSTPKSCFSKSTETIDCRWILNMFEKLDFNGRNRDCDTQPSSRLLFYLVAVARWGLRLPGLITPLLLPLCDLPAWLRRTCSQPTLVFAHIRSNGACVFSAACTDGQCSVMDVRNAGGSIARLPARNSSACLARVCFAYSQSRRAPPQSQHLFDASSPHGWMLIVSRINAVPSASAHGNCIANSHWKHGHEQET